MWPILFQSSYLTLFSYPFLMGIAWALGYFLSEEKLRSVGISNAQLPTLFLGCFVSSWVFAKLFFLMTLPSYYLKNLTPYPSFWMGGGLVFYGGLLGGLLFLWIYVGKLKKYPWTNLPHFLPGLTMAHAVGRVGCLLAGCCYGVESHSLFAVEIDGVSRLAVPLFESLFLILCSVYFWKETQKNAGVQHLLQYILFYAVFRFLIEYLRGDEIRGVYWDLFSTSQIISMAMILSVIAIVRWKKIKLFS